MLIYIVCLFWSFLGVAIAADIFMVGIETITSQEKEVEVELMESGKRKLVAKAGYSSLLMLSIQKQWKNIYSENFFI